MLSPGACELPGHEGPDHARCVRSFWITVGAVGGAAAPRMTQPVDLAEGRDEPAPGSIVGDRRGVARTALHGARSARLRALPRRPQACRLGAVGCRNAFARAAGDSG